MFSCADSLVGSFKQTFYSQPSSSGEEFIPPQAYFAERAAFPILYLRLHEAEILTFYNNGLQFIPSALSLLLGSLL
jgi:hypothetical protein